MLQSYSFFGLAFSIVLIIIGFYLISKKRITAGTFVLWILLGVGIGLVSTVPFLLELIYNIFGTQLLLSSVTAVAFGLLLILILYLYIRVDTIEDKLNKIAVQTTLINYEETKSNTFETSKKKIDE